MWRTIVGYCGGGGADRRCVADRQEMWRYRPAQKGGTAKGQSAGNSRVCPRYGSLSIPLETLQRWSFALNIHTDYITSREDSSSNITRENF